MGECRCGTGELRQITRAADWLQCKILVNDTFQRDGVSDLASLDHLDDRFKNAAVGGIGEMHRLQKIDAAIRDQVVDQQCAKNPLLSFAIGWRNARLVGGGGRVCFHDV